MKANHNSVFSDELNRRRFMAGALGFTMTAAMSGPLAAVAQNTGAARGAPRRVDFHHHFIPPRHLEAILAQRESGRTPPWSPEMSLAEMDKNGIATSITSLVQPGVWLGGVENSRKLARDWSARLALVGRRKLDSERQQIETWAWWHPGAGR